MVREHLTGSRIRAVRLDRAVKQADLARACDISASYLNLIEHNRRRIGGGLLMKIAGALEIDPSRLTGGAATGIAQAMDAAAEALPAARAERDRAEDMATRFPGWARVIDAQQAEIRRLGEVVARLNDRLTHDPFLSASMHNVLSSVTGIRSASAILAQGGEIEPEWQARFHRNIYEDSRRLAEATETLVRYLDTAHGDQTEGALPQDEIDAWLARRDWHFAELETDPAADFADLIGGEAALSSSAARHLARTHLTRYAGDAARLPLDRLSDALAGEGPDPAGLADRLSVDLPLLFRRLAALPPVPGAHPLGFGLAACDASGALTFRKPLPGFDLPRYSAGCPLWPLFEALRRPMEPVRRRLLHTAQDDTAVEAFAIAEVKPVQGFGRPGAIEAWMLLAPHSGPDAGEGALRVGTSCRICAEPDCFARREPSVFAPGP